jgi:hypothetical protein
MIKICSEGAEERKIGNESKEDRKRKIGNERTEERIGERYNE